MDDRCHCNAARHGMLGNASRDTESRKGSIEHIDSDEVAIGRKRCSQSVSWHFVFLHEHASVRDLPRACHKSGVVSAP